VAGLHAGERNKHYTLLKHQRDDMLRLQLQKERLTAFVVHDLKNPVNSMDLHAQLLQRNRGLPADARESVATIRSEARLLTRMISNLLDISKADEGQLSPKRSEVDLRALVDEVLLELGASAHAREVGLRSSIEAEQIHADRVTPASAVPITSPIVFTACSRTPLNACFARTPASASSRN
jgi:two-component system, sensor histidine kinase and response regulator